MSNVNAQVLRSFKDKTSAKVIVFSVKECNTYIKFTYCYFSKFIVKKKKKSNYQSRKTDFLHVATASYSKGTKRLLDKKIAEVKFAHWTSKLR